MIHVHVPRVLPRGQAQRAQHLHAARPGQNTVPSSESAVDGPKAGSGDAVTYRHALLLRAAGPKVFARACQVAGRRRQRCAFPHRSIVASLVAHLGDSQPVDDVEVLARARLIPAAGGGTAAGRIETRHASNPHRASATRGQGTGTGTSRALHGSELAGRPKHGSAALQPASPQLALILPCVEHSRPVLDGDLHTPPASTQPTSYHGSAR